MVKSTIMGKRNSLSIEIKEKILQMHKDKIKQVNIAGSLGISQQAVSLVLKKANEDGFLSSHKPGAGRKPITTDRDLRQLRKIVRNNRFQTVSDVQNKLQEQGIVLSKSTALRRIKETYSSYKAKVKPLLNKKQKKKRLDWCHIYKEKDPNFWKGIIFSDESMFNIPIGHCGRVWRKKGESFNTDCTRKCVKHPGGLMIWGCMDYKGVGKLLFVSEKINSQVYQDILNEGLIPTLNDHFPDGISEFTEEQPIFQQDLAPAHNSKSTKKWFSDNNINVLPWPANSPDLNVIENVWRDIKFAINRTDPRPRTKEELKELILKIWNNYPVAKCRELIDSMPRRCITVINSKGETTKY